MKPVTDVEAVTNSEDKLRKSLHELQPSATDKETLVGADRMVKPTQKSNETKVKKSESIKIKKDVPKKQKKTTTDDTQITAEDKKQIEINDLTRKNPAQLSETYWQELCEKRRIALVETLKENKKLVEENERLEAEKKIYEEMLNDARALIEVLQEMIGNDGSGINNSLEDSVL